MDTGSPDFWIMSKNCTSDECTHQEGYDASASSTARRDGANFTISYGSGKVSGKWGNDIVSLAGASKPQSFGIVDTVNTHGLFSKYKTGGIMGLGWGTGPHAKPLWQAMFGAGLFETAQFGIYLERDLSTHTEDMTTAPGGQLTLGGVDESVMTGDINWVDMVQMNQPWWTVTANVKVGGKEYAGGNGSALIDSGSSIISGEYEQVKGVYDMIPGAAQLGNTWAIPCNTTTTVSWSFNGVDYPMYLGDLILDPMPSNSTLCMGGIQGINFKGAGDGSVRWLLGASFMKNVYSVFRYDPPAVGFASLTDDANHRDPSRMGSAASVPTSSASTTSNTSSAPASSSATSTSSAEPKTATSSSSAEPETDTSTSSSSAIPSTPKSTTSLDASSDSQPPPSSTTTPSSSSDKPTSSATAAPSVFSGAAHVGSHWTV